MSAMSLPSRAEFTCSAISGQLSGDDVDLRSVTVNNVGDGGVAQGQILIEFAEAVVDEENTSLAKRRDEVILQLGEDAMVDAAAVIAIFNAIDRVADATGIPLDDLIAVTTEDMRAELGIDNFASAKND